VFNPLRSCLVLPPLRQQPSCDASSSLALSATLVLQLLLSLEPLCPDPLSLSNRHHPGAALAVEPLPDVHIVEPAAVFLVPLRVGGGVSNTLVLLEAVWDSRVTVAADEAQNEGGAPHWPQHVGHKADVEAGQAQFAGRVIEHGHSSSLHDAVRGKVNATDSMGSNVLK
jgi:hypothetical protein